MCGICGIYNLDRNMPVRSDVIVTMRDVMAYRGPDDSGLHIKGNIGLGHRRLSVIDLDTGHQPMYNEDGSIVIVPNGEIYNYIELKDTYLKHHQFRTRSDTEVVIHLYEEFGMKCLDLLNGMFAFALHDERNGKTFLARDHFGIKPLYYYRDGERLVFASEIKSILAAGVRPVVNEQMVLEYLAFQYYTGEDTLFKDIFRLEPGCFIELSNGSMSRHSFWDIDCTEDMGLTEDTCLEKIEWLLSDSVRMQLRSDVPLGCHLSGGVDTAIVAGLASRHELNGALKTFTAYFQREGGVYDDSAFAGITARHNGAEMYKLGMSDDDFFSSLETIFYHLDEPCAGEGVVPQYYVSKIASENVKVVLGGQGADEMFGGYARYYILYYLYLAELAAKGARSSPAELVLNDVLDELPQLNNYQGLFQSALAATAGKSLNDKYFFLINRLKEPGKVLNPAFMEKNGSYDPIARMNRVFDRWDSSSILNRTLYYEMKSWLPALLHIEDRTSMKWSLESRVPILDKRLCEFAFQIPARMKFAGGRLKYILKRSMRGVLPGEIRDRRDKIGFPVPMFMWRAKLKHYLTDLIDSVDQSEYIFRKEFLDSVSGNVAEFDRMTWGVISILNWFRIFKPSI
jgi:asparagine synthase (glutamine-hydrolysing)